MWAEVGLVGGERGGRGRWPPGTDGGDSWIEYSRDIFHDDGIVGWMQKIIHSA